RGLDEARPTRPRVELRLGAEELRAAAGAAIDPGRVLVRVGAGERTLGALLAQDRVALGSEPLAPLLVRQLQLGLHDPSVAARRRGQAPRRDQARPSASYSRRNPSKSRR